MIALALGGVAQADWAGVGALSSGRYNHTATLLADGRVLVTGGHNGGALDSSQLYDAKKNTWSNAASMHIARTGQAAVLLKSGKVLVAGGFAPGDPAATHGGYTKTAEIYDPETNSWTQTGDMSAARYQPTMTLLDDGRVLVAGGSGDTDNLGAVPLASAEVFNPDTGTWSDAAAMSVARADTTATLLKNGRVLVAGGYDEATGKLSSAEAYHPDTDTWSPAGALAEARDSATATALPNGDVLVAGGDGGKDAALATAEVFDASAGTWHTTGSMAAGRQTAAAALLKDGTVLVTGGENARFGDLLDSAERYDADAGTWSPAGTLAAPRKEHTLTALQDGRALVVGGNPGGFDQGLTGLERFSAMTTTLTDASFGSELVGNKSGVKTSVLTNTGNLPIDVTGVSIVGANAHDFSIDSESCSGAAVQPGQTCEIGVQFAPSAGGARSAQLSVTDNQTAAGQSTGSLSGTGNAPAGGGNAPAGNAPAGNAPAATPSTQPKPAAATGSGSAPAPRIGVAGTSAKSGSNGKRPGARAACTVKKAKSGRSTVTCRVSWPTRAAVALNARLMRGSKQLASSRVTARGGRAVVTLRPADRLRSGRYTVLVSRRGGATLIRQGMRVR